MLKCRASVCIVSYNTADLTLQTLHSLLKAIEKLPNSYSIEIVIVDNNSTDDSIHKIKGFQTKYQSENLQIKIIKNKDNVGFAAANNQAVAVSKGEYILLLNSDTILKPEALEHLLADYQTLESEKSNIGLLAAQLLNSDESLQPQGGALPNLLTLKSQMFFLHKIPVLGQFLPSIQQPAPEPKHRHQISPRGWVGATALLLSRKVWDKIGPLDQNIFMYGEDVDYCWRAHKLDIRSAIDLDAKVIHLGSQSSSSANALVGELKTMVYLFHKHKPNWQLPFAYLILLLGSLLRFIIFKTLTPNSQKAASYLKAWREIKVIYNKY